MDLVIAEKPDIAKAVSKVIPGTPSWKNGYIEQGNYCITWCYGHLLTLKDPEDYGDEYAVRTRRTKNYRFSSTTGGRKWPTKARLS